MTAQPDRITTAADQPGPPAGPGVSFEQMCATAYRLLGQAVEQLSADPLPDARAGGRPAWHANASRVRAIVAIHKARALLHEAAPTTAVDPSRSNDSHHHNGNDDEGAGANVGVRKVTW